MWKISTQKGLLWNLVLKSSYSFQLDLNMDTAFYIILFVLKKKTSSINEIFFKYLNGYFQKEAIHRLSGNQLLQKLRSISKPCVGQFRLEEIFHQKVTSIPASQITSLTFPRKILLKSKWTISGRISLSKSCRHLLIQIQKYKEVRKV